MTRSAGVGGDEVHGLNALVALNGKQQMAQKNGAAGAGGGDGQILRRLVRQRISRSLAAEVWSIGTTDAMEVKEQQASS